jgi:hypothetical protein
MKDDLILLLVSIVVVGGVAVWLLGLDPVEPFRYTNGRVRQEQETPLAGSQAKAKQASRPSRSRIPQKSAVVEHAPTPKTSTAAAIDAGDQFPASPQKETNAKTYGEPALSTTKVDRGRELETLVYTRDRGKEIRVISLEDGKVPLAPSEVKPASDTPQPRSVEHTAALLAGPGARQPAPTGIPATAEATKSIPNALNNTPVKVTTAIPPERPWVQPKLGTCGEYRDGKLTVKPCSEVPLDPSEWLTKGSADAATESAPAGHRR